MALNNLGLGFTFTAKDLASGVITKVQRAYENLLGLKSRDKGTGQFVSNKDAFGTMMTGDALKNVGERLMSLTNIFEPAIKEAADFSKAIALVATESEEAIFPQEKMREVAEKLAVTFGKAPVDQAKALYKAVALGANDAAKATDFLTGVNLLAVAGNADLELTANALGGALNAYNEPFSKATQYSDALFTAMKNGNTTVQDLAASIGRVTSTASSMNISIDETLGAIAVMTNKGVEAREAVSGLKEALANVVHPSAAAAAEAARLGIKFNQATLRAKGLQGFLAMISGSAKFNAESFSKLFTSVEGSSAIIQVASGNMKSFNDIMVAMKNKTGATQKGFEIMTETLDFQNQKYEANKKVALGIIGHALEPMQLAIVKLKNRILEAFAKIPKPIIAAGLKFMIFATTIIGIVGAALALKGAIASLMVVFQGTAIVVGAVLLALAPLLAAIGVLTFMFYGVREAYDRNLGGFGEFVEKTMHKVALVFQALGQLFEQGGFSGALREELNTAENIGIKRFAINVYVWVKRIQHFFESLSDAFYTSISKAEPQIKKLMSALDKLFSALGFLGKGEAADQAAATFDRFGSVGERVGDTLATVFSYLVDVVTSAVNVFAEVTAGIGKAWDASEGARNSFSMIGAELDKAMVSLGLADPQLNTTAGFFNLLAKGAHVAAAGIENATHAIEVALHPMLAMLRTLNQIVATIKMIPSGIMSLKGNKDASLGDIKEAFRPAATAGLMGSMTMRGNKNDVEIGNLPGLPPPPGASGMPAVAASGGHAEGPGDMTSMKEALDTIAANTAPKEQVIYTQVVLDGETIGRAVTKASKGAATRSLTPTPSPT